MNGLKNGVGSAAFSWLRWDGSGCRSSFSLLILPLVNCNNFSLAPNDEAGSDTHGYVLRLLEGACRCEGQNHFMLLL